MKNLPGLDLPIAIAHAVDDSDHRDLRPGSDRFQLDLLAPQQHPPETERPLADINPYITKRDGKT